MDRLQGRRARATHRLALSPSCWGVSEVKDWGHQIDAERVLSECAAVGEGAITAGPPGFLPDRSDHARKLLRRNRLQVVAGQVQAILHHHETRGPELAHIDVDLDLAREVRERSLEYREAVSRSLYRPLGEGGAKVARVTEALRRSDYRGWYSLEQDTRLATTDDRPLGQISRSLEFVLPLLTSRLRASALRPP